MEQDQDIEPHPVTHSVSHQSLAWQLIKSYWRSKQRFPAYLFFTIVLVLTVSLVALDVVFNYLYYYFYDELCAYDKHGIVRLFLVAFMLTSFYLIFESYRYGLSLIVEQRSRRWLIGLFTCWAKQKERFQEDVGTLINYSLDLSVSLIGVITTSIVLIYILWQLSGEMHLSFGSLGVLVLPGYFVWMGVIYALVGTYFTFKIGRPMLSPEFEQRQKAWLWVVAGFYQLSVILPLLVALPDSLDKILLLPWLIQSVQTFNRMQSSAPVVNSARFDAGAFSRERFMKWMTFVRPLIRKKA